MGVAEHAEYVRLGREWSPSPAQQDHSDEERSVYDVSPPTTD